MERRSLHAVKRVLGNVRLTMDGAPLQAGEDRVSDPDDSQGHIDPERRRIPVFIVGVLLSSVGFLLVAYGAKRFEDRGLKSKGWREFGWLSFGALVLLGGFSLMFIVVPWLLR
jgi:hypothetical protein